MYRKARYPSRESNGRQPEGPESGWRSNYSRQLLISGPLTRKVVGVASGRELFANHICEDVGSIDLRFRPCVIVGQAVRHLFRDERGYGRTPCRFIIVHGFFVAEFAREAGGVERRRGVGQGGFGAHEIFFEFGLPVDPLGEGDAALFNRVGQN
jgi:hypothetical protein